MTSTSISTTPPSSPDRERRESSSSSSSSGSFPSETYSDSDYPLSGAVSDPSIDAASVFSDDRGSGGRPQTLEQVSQEDRDEAARLKKEANASFASSQYRVALDLYTASINRNPFEATIWCNRAACRLKFEEYGLAIADATEAANLNSSYTKAYFRRASGQLAILKPKLALPDLKKVIELDPNNAAGKLQLQSVQKLVRKMEFEKAISSKDVVTVTQRLTEQLESNAEPDSSYTGPRLHCEEVIDDSEASGSGESKSKSKKKYSITQTFIDEMIDHFRNGKTIHRQYAWAIVLGAQAALAKHQSLVEITVKQGQKCVVTGDTHGQFFDLLHLLSLSQFPSSTDLIVFNGDFVDRGSWSTEVILVLFAFKWLYPDRCFLNRGNHETSDMNKVYGFEGETVKKYSDLTYKLFEETFNQLTLATLVNCSSPPRPNVKSTQQDVILGPDGTRRFFVVHGGLFSKDNVSLEDVRNVTRNRQPGGEGIMCEMLWTDPQDNPGRGPSKRGVGVSFGPDVTRKWTEANQISAVIRSHEVRPLGYSVEHHGLCITVFSAPNYVDQAGNQAAYVTINEYGEMDFTTFDAQPHPDVRPMAYAGGFGLANLLS